MASPQNRARWGFEDYIECTLCGKKESSFVHILAGCQKVGDKMHMMRMQCGRYAFRHNAVLRVIAHQMQVMIIIGVIQREGKKI